MENLNEIKLEILRVKIQLTEISIKLSEVLKKQKFDLATEYRDQKKEVNDKLAGLEALLIKKYEELELNSSNVSTLHEISNLLLEFKSQDKMFFEKVNDKIEELVDKTEIANKNHDFKLATEYGEEIMLLNKYLRINKKIINSGR